MKYYKTEDTFGTQPNNIIPSNATEITYEEYLALQTAFEERQKKIADYVQEIEDGIITLAEVPEEYYDEVYAIVSAVEPDPDQEFIDRLISEVIS
jgi:hypothetical protein